MRKSLNKSHQIFKDAFGIFPIALLFFISSSCSSRCVCFFLLSAVITSASAAMLRDKINGIAIFVDNKKRTERERHDNNRNYITCCCCYCFCWLIKMINFFRLRHHKYHFFLALCVCLQIRHTEMMNVCENFFPHRLLLFLKLISKPILFSVKKNLKQCYWRGLFLKMSKDT